MFISGLSSFIMFIFVPLRSHISVNFKNTYYLLLAKRLDGCDHHVIVFRRKNQFREVFGFKFAANVQCIWQNFFCYFISDLLLIFFAQFCTVEFFV